MIITTTTGSKRRRSSALLWLNDKRCGIIDNAPGFRRLDIPAGKSAFAINPFLLSAENCVPFFKQHNTMEIR